MDTEANMAEQTELAANVLRIWDMCDEDGEFTEDQKQNLICDAYRMAELIQAMAEWNAKQDTKNTVFTVSSGNGADRDITVRNDGEWGIGIGMEGYGVCEVNDLDCFPVYVEWYNDHPRVIVWGDINSPDPTHAIDLDGALESRRKPE